MLEVQKYLRSGHTLQQLSQRYNIQCNICEELNLAALNYTNLSPMEELLVKECRGLFLDLNTWNIACKSLGAFFDIDVNIADTIDWKTAKLMEKLDGALITIYYYKDKWNIGMRMSADGSMKATAINGILTDLTFAELTKKTIEEMGYTWEDYTSKLDTNIFYSYELCCPETRCGVIYPDRKLTLIAAVNKKTLKNIDIYNLQWPIEKVTYYNVENRDEVENYLQKYSDPLISEGFVLIDENFNRVKYKNPEYVTMMSDPDSDNELESLEQLLQYVSSFSSTSGVCPCSLNYIYTINATFSECGVWQGWVGLTINLSLANQTTCGWSGTLGGEDGPVYACIYLEIVNSPIQSIATLRILGGSGCVSLCWYGTSDIIADCASITFNKTAGSAPGPSTITATRSG